MSASTVAATAAFSRESDWARHLASLALPLLLCVYFGLALAYSVDTPTLEGTDETRHLIYVNHLLTERELPLLAREIRGDPGERFQPPFYYAVLAALLTASNVVQIETRLVAEVSDGRGVYLHARDGGIPDDARTVHLLRISQIAFGLLTVYFTYRLAALVVDCRSALSSAMMVAGLPLFLHISSVLNNDNLANCLSALTLFLLLKTWLQDNPGFGRATAIGVVLGVALLTKVTTTFLVPVAVVVLASKARNAKRRWILPTWSLAVAGALGGWFPLLLASTCGKPCSPGLSGSGTTLLLNWNSWKRTVGSFSGYFSWTVPPPDLAARVALTFLWAAGVGLAVWAITRGRAPQSVRLIAGASALALVQFLFFFWSYGLWHARYLFVSLPALATLWSFGFNGSFRRAGYLLPMLAFCLLGLNTQVLFRLLGLFQIP